jgi:hypothetical protein
LRSWDRHELAKDSEIGSTAARALLAASRAGSSGACGMRGPGVSGRLGAWRNLAGKEPKRRVPNCPRRPPRFVREVPRPNPPQPAVNHARSAVPAGPSRRVMGIGNAPAGVSIFRL